MARTAPHAKEGILLAARRCFAETGFRGSSLSQIARAYGGAKSSLLYHFDSKDAILQALLDPHWTELKALAGELEELDGRAARERAIEGLADLAVRYRDDLALFHGELPTILEFEHFKDARRALDTILSALVLGATDPAAQMTANLLVGGIASLCHEYPTAAPELLRGVVRRVLRVTLEDVRNQG
ncbi:TetR/AcrR family transcriptional regulator [Cellulomonas sp. KRMCY2]|uniref:TetR/AcrR family transcriptional regulator n=1 Tax=Cellulomonas sp. KRMCY2 TaxID=1304865 RepID=UPI00045E6E17|nr:TetR/AcrR family transcriptional regulator [Cellulomonas sp. KRMCY2]